jgi:gliding motility-associated-like protein
MKKIFLFAFALISFNGFTQIELSRDVIGSAGKSVSNDNLQMSYTIGEPFTATIQNNIIKTLGFQQPDALPATELPFAIPGGLSPNGDGINDTWNIQGLEDYPGTSISVFDRWGKKLFFSTSASEPWNGTFEGKELPTADYYYIIELDNGEKYHGVVTLKK